MDGLELLVFCLAHLGSNGVFSFAPGVQYNIDWRQGISIVGQLIVSVSSFLIHHGGFHGPYYIPLNVFTASKGSNFYILLHSLLVFCDDSLTN